MFTIARQIEIDAGHRVPYHNSNCRHLHGHRWKIVAHVSAPDLVVPNASRADSGMVVDYGVIKQALVEQIHHTFDHRLLLWEQDPLVLDEMFAEVLNRTGIYDSIRMVPIIPTSEGLAKYWAGLLAPVLNGQDIQLVQLDVWETPNCAATYRLR